MKKEFHVYQKRNDSPSCKIATEKFDLSKRRVNTYQTVLTVITNQHFA
jgi:hypothetical protein